MTILESSLKNMARRESSYKKTHNAKHYIICSVGALHLDHWSNSCWLVLDFWNDDITVNMDFTMYMAEILYMNQGTKYM